MHDASGKSIVIECVGGKLNVYDNLLGVLTNSPGFDWHMTNLRKNVNFSMSNAPPVQLGPVNSCQPARARACSGCREISHPPYVTFAPSR